MKYTFLLVVGVCLGLLAPASLRAAIPVTDGDTIFVWLSPERMDVYPPQYIASTQQTSKRLKITTTDGNEHVYRLSMVDSVFTHFTDTLMPKFDSYKFNNKFNDQVFTDALGEIEGDSLIRVTVGAIGKWLTPSFQINDSLAYAYSDGVRQNSKVTRRRFDMSVYYTVTRPGWQIIGAVPQENQEESTPEPVVSGEETVTAVSLTAGMLSTNAPSNYGEDPANLLDNDVTTIFHSTWGSGTYQKLPAGVCPYLDVKLPEALHHLQFSYTNRHNTSDRYTTGLRLYASKDGTNWTTIRDFALADDKLPTGLAESWQSPTINLGADYTYLRFEQTSCAYHNNYLAWSEFSLYKVTIQEATPEPEPEEEEPAEDDELQWTPFGRHYRVTVDWPTDRATMVPTIIIYTENSEMVSSKDYYLNATIDINGAGVFPDMESTDVLIKGRGNSSWSGYAWDKNPYRLKFSVKVKPFGLTKGKNWVLQANKQTGSMMVNAVGMKAAHLFGAVAANHVVPVELYMNGGYRGNYIFNEKLGFSNNSIDLDDESAATFLELDSYSETGQFRTTYYSMPVNIKEPDFDDETAYTVLTKEDITSDVNALMKAVSQKNGISDWVDVDYLASFLSVNELVGNYELMHPKSTYLYKENLFGDSKYIFGPVWDLDWAYGYETNHAYCTTGSKDDFYSNPAHTFYGGSNANRADLFWKNLRYADEAVDRAYYTLWTRFMNDGGLDELLDFCEEYYTYANPSFQHNAQMWGDGYSYSTTKTNMVNWLRQRATYIYSKLTPYDLTGVFEDPVSWTESEAYLDNDDPEDPDAIALPQARPTLFTVYDLRGMLLKRNATFDTWRNGLAPGIYIVNGKKVLVP